MGAILAAWIVEIGLITYRGVSGKEPAPLPLPLPADYLASVAVFGALSLAGRSQAATPAALVAWGLVVATALNLWTPKTGKPKAKASAPAKKGT